MTGPSRRQFLTGGAAALAAATIPGLADAAAQTAATVSPLPNPASSGLDHIVVIVMENRSFDHYLGWLPGADGRQAGLRYPDNRGHLHPTHHLLDTQGCGFNDPDHSYAGGRIQYDNGKLDGFRRGANDDYALGYYEKADLPLYGPLLEKSTTFDRYFCSILAPTYPNRLYTHAAYTDRLDNYTRTTALPTIWDRLAAAGVSARYYFSDLPFLALWGEQYLPIAAPISRFYADALSGTLPSFSYLDPFFEGEDQGGSNDDHPHADIRRGQAFLSLVVNALAHSPLWDRTALVITYDEWGGFFDHVKPPRLPDSHNSAPGGPADHAQAGFRVPCILFSPFAQPGRVGHRVYDHTSILKMVEWRWRLRPLTQRDAAARNLAEVLDFRAPQRTAPSLPVVADPGPHLCGSPIPATDSFWPALAELAAKFGWDHLR